MSHLCPWCGEQYANGVACDLCASWLKPREQPSDIAQQIGFIRSEMQGACPSVRAGDREWILALIVTEVEKAYAAGKLAGVAALPSTPTRPQIICLCGSTRFIETFAVKTWELELEGHIVLGCTLLPHWYCPVRDHFAESLGVKEQRDNHHLQKIDLADEVLVLNVDGYIGESTRREIEYATANGKPISYLVPSVPSSEETKERP